MPEYRCFKCDKVIDRALVVPRPTMVRFGTVGEKVTRIVTCPHCSGQNKFEVPRS